MKRAMLLSSSRVHGYEFLEHAREAIRSYLNGADDLVFVPYALADHDTYVEKVRVALDGVCRVRGAHRLSESEFKKAEAIFVGGGNTFRLLKQLQDRQLLSTIHERVVEGAAYIGASAGTNVACPTIRTTNDMPIVEPAGLNAIGLVPFQINPHFVQGALAATHNGETREERIAEFLEENDGPVVGLREPARLLLDGTSLRIEGDAGGVLFQRNTDPRELAPGSDLSFLLDTPALFV